MLHIRNEQLEALALDLYARFDDDACAHVKRYFPAQCEILSEAALLQLVRGNLRRARGFGLFSQYDLLRYLNLTFTLGNDFEQQASCAWALPFLQATDQSPTSRMDQLMEEAYAHLYPVTEVPAPEQGDEAEDDSGMGFDGVVWDDTSVDASYVPQSIQPEYEPFIRPPAPGTVAAADVAPVADPFEIEEDDDQDDDEMGSDTLTGVTTRG